MRPEDIVVTNLHAVPGRTIVRILGMAFGHHRVQEEHPGRPIVRSDGASWPWNEDPDHFENLYRLAETRMRERAAALGADAVLNVTAGIDRDLSGRPGMTVVGTAVLLGEEKIPGPQRRDVPPTVPIEGAGGDYPSDVNITFAGRREKWKPMEAVQSKGRGRGTLRRAARPRETDVSEMARDLEITIERAKVLSDAGITRVIELAEARTQEIARLPGFNPTQARLLIEKARAILSDPEGER